MSALLHRRLRACRSFDLTPGSRPDGFRDARGDAIIVDLESTVAPSDKGRARKAALAFLRQSTDTDFARILRINGPRLVEGLRDLLALHASGTHPDAVVIPKCRAADEIRVVADLLEDARSTSGIIPMVELARAVFDAVTRAHSIMAAPTAVGTSTPVVAGHVVEPAVVCEAERVLAIVSKLRNDTHVSGVQPKVR